MAIAAIPSSKWLSSTFIPENFSASRNSRTSAGLSSMMSNRISHWLHFSVGVCRQLDSESGSLTNIGFHPYSAMMFLDDSLADCQPNAGTGSVSIQTFEDTEDVLMELRLDPGSVVLDSQNDFAV